MMGGREKGLKGTGVYNYLSIYIPKKKSIIIKYDVKKIN